MSSTEIAAAEQSSQTATALPAIASPDKRDIRRIFDSIAARYDFLNTILSLNLDERWRIRARDLVLDGTERSLLDLGVGTGRFIRLFLAAKKWNRAAGLDFSSGMLQKARRELPSEVRLVSADFHDLPFHQDSFDLVISSFALRSVKDMPRFLAGIYDLLTERGKVALLCLTRPQNVLWKFFYYPYLNFYLPLVGRLISGNREAYQFLSKSVQTFQDPSKTVEMMRAAGFGSITVHPFTLGSATLILGKK